MNLVARKKDKTKKTKEDEIDENVMVEAFGVLDCPFVPLVYQPDAVLKRLCSRSIRRLRAANLKMPILPRAVQERILQATQDVDAESSSSYEDGLDKTSIQQMIGYEQGTLEFGLPIRFQVKQNLRLLTTIKKHSNKLCDLSEFRRQKVDIYITTNGGDAPGPFNY